MIIYGRKKQKEKRRTVTNIILDTSALLAYYNKEPGFMRVREVLSKDGFVCHIHAVNAIEVYYKLAGKFGTYQAEEAYTGLSDLNISIHECLDQKFQLHCASLKNAFPPLSLADVMVVALSRRLGGLILTSDKEFNRAKTAANIEQIR